MYWMLLTDKCLFNIYMYWNIQLLEIYKPIPLSSRYLGRFSISWARREWLVKNWNPCEEELILRHSTRQLYPSGRVVISLWNRNIVGLQYTSLIQASTTESWLFKSGNIRYEKRGCYKNYILMLSSHDWQTK